MMSTLFELSAPLLWVLAAIVGAIAVIRTSPHTSRPLAIVVPLTAALTGGIVGDVLGQPSASAAFWSGTLGACIAVALVVVVIWGARDRTTMASP